MEQNEIVAIIVALFAILFFIFIFGNDRTPKNLKISSQGFYLKAIVPPVFPETQILATLTAYNPTPEQCDSTPDITASGKKVAEGMIANNCLKFGTVIRIGEKNYIVEDRMNEKWDCEHFDILMFSEEEAIKFGKQERELVIY